MSDLMTKPDTASGNSLGHGKDVLVIDRLEKSLGGNKILQSVSMSVRSGETHALMGGNGAGKSTLIKCLSGYWTPNGGRITVGGEPLSSEKKQIAFVQQDLGLIPSLNVAENIFLGAGYQTGRFANVLWRKQSKDTAALLAELGHSDIDPVSEIRDLNPVQRTIVAIARAAKGLKDGAKVLVLDEPTASLPVAEIDRLFKTLEVLKKSGVGMIYVSHHLSEVFELSDKISVLREGNLVSTKATTETSETEVVEQMLGTSLRKVSRDQRSSDQPTNTPILQAHSLSGARVTDLSMTVQKGEILGLTGLQGSGCTELAEMIFGAKQPALGAMIFDGFPANFRHPSDAIQAGIALVTEDRHLDGSFSDHTVAENMSITDLGRFFRKGWLFGKHEADEANTLVEEFDIRPADAQRRFTSLSGGNQQKVVLAKWVRTKPKLLICDQPDIGVDIGAKNAIYAKLQEAADDGAGVIVISNQNDDLAAICDRVIVMRAGQIVKELIGNRATEHAISMAAIGTIEGTVGVET